MSHTLTIRLTDELAEWLRENSRRSGIPAGRIIREQLEKARNADHHREEPWMKLIGSIKGPRDLSSRKGFEGQPYPGTRRRKRTAR
jgi:hypothetical protein